jgi:Rieske Fe-S protein
VTAVDYRWSAQDYMPADDIPYIGKVTSGSERIFVGTGFKKWGMTSGTLAAMINADLILGRDNPWASLFDSTRVNLTHSAMSLVTANLDVAKQFVGDHLGSIVSRSVHDLSPGEGRIAHLDGERVAAYRDPDGVLHAVSPICTHMGCVVSWNSAETTWDCPCHGSRFFYDGRVIEGPAVEPLDVKTAPTDVATGKKSER